MSTSGSESDDTAVVSLSDSEEDEEEDSSDSSDIVVTYQRGPSRRHAVLNSHSLVGPVSSVSEETEQGPPGRQQHRGARVILSSDEEENIDEVVIKKPRREPEEADDKNGGNSSGDEAGNCSICFEAYTNSGPHRVVCLKCGHLFGQVCIERWIRTEKNAKCPQCKAKTRLVDIRRLFAHTVKALDTTEMESLKQANVAYKAENESLRLENEQLKAKIAKGAENTEYKLENEKLRLENEQLKAMIGIEDGITDAARLVTSTADEITKRQFLLVPGPVISLSSEPGSRSLDENGECFVVTCKIRNDIFLPYGLKLITVDGREDVLVPVHNKKPRCCAFSPFDSRVVLSTGADNTLCVTSFGDNPAVLHRIELPAIGWSCCWLSANEVVVGLVNGRVLKFSLLDTTADPYDITRNNGRFPIISVLCPSDRSLLFVVSLKECVLYHNMQPHVLISDQGAINSFCYDHVNSNVMLSFAPGERHETVTHVMYKLLLDNEHKELLHYSTFKSRSRKSTRIVKSAFWSTPDGPVAVVYDESNAQLVLVDFLRNRQEVVYRMSDAIIAIKEIATNDARRFRLGCLSETAMNFFEVWC